jgi:hypothetical protein
MVSGPRAARNLAGPTQLPFENLRAPGCTCEIHEMDYTGTRHIGAIDGERVGHDLDCALVRRDGEM